VLRCVLLEITLNAGSVVLEGAARRTARPPRRAQHVGPFYGASVYSCSL